VPRADVLRASLKPPQSTLCGHSRAYTASAIFAIGCALDGAEEDAMSKPSFLHIVVTALFVVAGRPALAVDQTTID
jgi:hypothetical protein